MDKVILHNGKVYAPIDKGIFKGYAEVPTASAAPSLQYTGPKISLDLWKQIIAFFIWSQETHQCESQVRLYLNMATNSWKAWALPQWQSGMTTSLIEGDDLNAQDNAMLADGSMEAGSVHHHCTAQAFQSGTDSSDEARRAGIHLTVGNILSEEHSLHSRVTFMHAGTTTQYTSPPLGQWFELPQEFRNLGLTEKIASDILEMLLKKPWKDVAFPDQWKANLRKREHVTISAGGSFGSLEQWRAKQRESRNWNSDWEPGGMGAYSPHHPLAVSKTSVDVVGMVVALRGIMHENNLTVKDLLSWFDIIQEISHAKEESGVSWLRLEEILEKLLDDEMKGGSGGLTADELNELNDLQSTPGPVNGWSGHLMD